MNVCLLECFYMEKYKKKIYQFYYQNKRMPSYSEIMTLVNFKSKNSVFKLINRLQKAGLITKDSKGKLIPKKELVKVLGLIEAGFPSSTEEENLNTLSFDQFLVKNKESSYLLKVSGNSMKEAGILAGDLVLVDRSVSAKTDDIVIAQIDTGFTIKYLRQKNNLFYLQAANSDYKDIYPEDELKILAVVKAVIRKY